MAGQILVIEGRLPGWNDILLLRGRGPYAWNSKKNRLEEEIMYEIELCKIHPIEKGYFTFRFFEKNSRRDPDNISGAMKVVFDSLVRAQIIPNDSQKEILGIYLEFFVDKDRPRVEVFISENRPERYVNQIGEQ